MLKSHTIFSLALCSSLLLACSGGGGGGEEPARQPVSNPPAPAPAPVNSGPELTITAPPDGALSAAEEIIIEGTAADPDGVARVTVNGLDATSDNQFTTWSATVSLTPGPNEITISATDALGTQNNNAARLTVERGYLYDNASDAVMEPERQRAFLIDERSGSLLAIDAAERLRYEFSGPNSGSGPDWFDPIQLQLDRTQDRLLVFDRGRGAIVAVDPDSGERRILASADIGAGPDLSDAERVAFHPDGLVAYALSPASLTEVDLVTGQRQQHALSGSTVDTVRRCLLDAANQRILVTGSEHIYAIDLASKRVRRLH